MIARVGGALLLPFLLLFGPLVRGGEAQIVRGRVVDGDGTPVATARVTLLDQGSVVVRATSSAADGGFSISLDRAGSFRVRVEHLGFLPYLSSEFDLREDEERVFAISLSNAPIVMEGVTVEGTGRCSLRPEEAAAVFRVWEMAGSAFLEAPAPVLADELRGHRVVHYRRELDSDREYQLAVESREVFAAASRVPFITLASDNIIRGGFGQIAASDRQLGYYGPPADLFFSEDFLAANCFERLQEQGGRIGLNFRPAEPMPVTGIRGLIWLDPESLGVRLIEFRYIDPNSERSNGGGGEVEFIALGDGALLPARWRIWMPSRIELPPENVARGIATTLTWSEEGGIILDSGGRPLAGGAGILRAIEMELAGEMRGPQGLPAEVERPQETFDFTDSGDPASLDVGIVMRIVPRESYSRAAPVFTASLSSLSAEEIESVYASVPSLVDLLVLRFAARLTSDSRMEMVQFRNPPGSCRGAPHFVVDGVPTDPSQAVAISPRDVTSIEVISDGARTAFYGFRGACGVIEIRTR